MTKPEDIPQDVWDAALAVAPEASVPVMQMAFAEVAARAILAERERQRDMADCLEDMTNHYVRLVASGDCGNWSAETEIEVQAARKMVAAVRGEAA